MSSKFVCVKQCKYRSYLELTLFSVTTCSWVSPGLPGTPPLGPFQPGTSLAAVLGVALQGQSPPGSLRSRDPVHLGLLSFWSVPLRCWVS